MEVNMKNITLVLVTILGLIGLLGAIYLFFMINGLVVGTTANVATSGDINVSNETSTYLSGVESSYITNAQSLESKIGLALQIFSIVIILLLFGLGGMFAYRKFKDNKGGF